MTERYKILYSGGVGELAEKKSRFIATARPAVSEEEALLFIEEMRKKYWDASHNCYAYVIGDRAQIQRCSDDGEPGQTAGKPILDVLLGEEIRDACIVVTRYFGGTLLGTGGLVRAYSGAARAGLMAGCTVEKCPGRKLRVSSDYSWAGKLQYLAAQEKLGVLESVYTDRVAFTWLIPEEKAEQLQKKIMETTGGQAVTEDLGAVWYGLAKTDIWRTAERKPSPSAVVGIGTCVLIEL